MGLSLTVYWMVTSVFCVLLPTVLPTGWDKVRVCHKDDFLSCADDHQLVFADVGLTTQCPLRRGVSSALYREIVRLCYGRTSCTIDPLELLSNVKCPTGCLVLQLACVNPSRIHQHGTNIKDRWGILHSENYPAGGATKAVVSSLLNPGTNPVDRHQEVTLFMYMYDLSLSTSDVLSVCGTIFLQSEVGCEAVKMDNRPITRKVINITRTGGIQVITFRQLDQTELFILEYRFKDAPASESASVFTNITVRTTTDTTTTASLTSSNSWKDTTTTASLTSNSWKASSTTTENQETAVSGIEQAPISKNVIIGVSVGAGVLLLIIILTSAVTFRVLRNDEHGMAEPPAPPGSERNIYVVDLQEGKQDGIYDVTGRPAYSISATTAPQAASERTDNPATSAVYMDDGAYANVAGTTWREQKEPSPDPGPGQAGGNGSDKSVVSERPADVRESISSTPSATYNFTEVDGYAVLKKKSKNYETSG